jgi:hypothetical protein
MRRGRGDILSREERSIEYIMVVSITRNYVEVLKNINIKVLFYQLDMLKMVR